MSEKPNYYSIIPSEVRYDEGLVPNAKLLYAEITSLTNRDGVCWASDQYFMKLYNVERQTIQRWLKQLEDGEYISREVIYKKDTKEIDKRYIRVYTKMLQGYTQNSDKGIHKIVTDNNTSINTTSNNKRVGKTKFSPPSLEEVTAYCLERNNAIDPQAFIDFYESKGWYIGKNKMKDWKSAVRTWERRETKTTKLSNVATMPVYSKDTGDESEAEALRKELSDLWGKGETL